MDAPRRSTTLLLTLLSMILQELRDLPGGEYSLVARSASAWTVSIVVVSFPREFEPGHEVVIGSPDATDIAHSFSPTRLPVQAGARVRITLYDHDPHPGIDVPQHNLHIPAAGAKTEGRTTWGDVRILDLVAPSEPGEYAFFCEYHKDAMRGSVIVQKAG